MFSLVGTWCALGSRTVASLDFGYDAAAARRVCGGLGSRLLRCGQARAWLVDRLNAVLPARNLRRANSSRSHSVFTQRSHSIRAAGRVLGAQSSAIALGRAVFSRPQILAAHARPEWSQGFAAALHA